MSSFEKTKLKMIITNDIGATIEDRLEGEIRTTAELSGAAAALKQAAEKVPAALIAKIEQEVEEGLLKDSEVDKEQLVLQWVKKYMTRVGDFLSHLGDVEQQKAITQGGRVDGIKQTMAFIVKMRDAEKEKLQQLLDAARIQESGGLVDAARTAAEAARLEHGTAAERKAAEEAKQASQAKPTKKKSKRKTKAA